MKKFLGPSPNKGSLLPPGSSTEFELAIFQRDDNWLFIKTGVVLYASCKLVKQVLFTYFLFVSDFCFFSRAKVGKRRSS